jgi:hypothetical protein
MYLSKLIQTIKMSQINRINQMNRIIHALFP